jgi:hypothetical protein
VGLCRSEANRLECVGIDQLPLGMSYPDQVAHIAGLTRQAPMSGKCVLAVDATGVGAPVVDLLRPLVRPGTLYSVTLTGGDKVTKEYNNWHVPKRDIIGAAQVALQQHRLKIPKASAHAETLVRELQGYRVTIGANGHDTYGNDWRQAPHDDLVLALAIGIYVADHTKHRPIRHNFAELASQVRVDPGSKGILFP